MKEMFKDEFVVYVSLRNLRGIPVSEYSVYLNDTLLCISKHNLEFAKDFEVPNIEKLVAANIYRNVNDIIRFRMDAAPRILNVVFVCDCTSYNCARYKSSFLHLLSMYLPMLPSTKPSLTSSIDSYAMSEAMKLTTRGINNAKAYMASRCDGLNLYAVDYETDIMTMVEKDNYKIIERCEQVLL